MSVDLCIKSLDLNTFCLLTTLRTIDALLEQIILTLIIFVTLVNVLN